MAGRELALLAVLEHLAHENARRHPGAHHFYTLSVEASGQPDKGLASAKLLETLVPGSRLTWYIFFAHLHKHRRLSPGFGGINLAAIKADSISYCLSRSGRLSAFILSALNYHFLGNSHTRRQCFSLAWMAADKCNMTQIPGFICCFGIITAIYNGEAGGCCLSSAGLLLQFRRILKRGTNTGTSYRK